MKPSLRVLLILGFAWVPFVSFAPAAFAQETKPSGKPESFAERHELELKWANFLMLAGALGYLIGKHGGPFFAARSGSIRQDMVESRRQREEAEAEAADVDRRLANLEKEIAALRGDSQAQAQAENQRMAQHTADEIAKIQAHAEQEIVSAGKAARMQLKRYSAQLAVELAERKIRARMTPQTQDALVRGFVRDLK
jgi:F-type H+-transporting ATPase subunit b